MCLLDKQSFEHDVIPIRIYVVIQAYLVALGVKFILLNDFHVSLTINISFHFTVKIVIIIINIEDTTAPEINGCPGDIKTTTELGTSGTRVTWNEPWATDLSGESHRMQSYAPGTEFPIGETIVKYTFADDSNNTATCSFSVSVETGW